MNSPIATHDTSLHAVVLFDGVCNLCNGAVKFVISRSPELHTRREVLSSESHTLNQRFNAPAAFIRPTRNITAATSATAARNMAIIALRRSERF
jgi:predicted DCC family thiol-disulfide oxidoreductase YuxK